MTLRNFYVLLLPFAFVGMAYGQTKNWHDAFKSGDYDDAFRQVDANFERVFAEVVALNQPQYGDTKDLEALLKMYGEYERAERLIVWAAGQMKKQSGNPQMAGFREVYAGISMASFLEETGQLQRAWKTLESIDVSSVKGTDPFPTAKAIWLSRKIRVAFHLGYEDVCLEMFEEARAVPYSKSSPTGGYVLVSLLASAAKVVQIYARRGERDRVIKEAEQAVAVIEKGFGFGGSTRVAEDGTLMILGPEFCKALIEVGAIREALELNGKIRDLVSAAIDSGSHLFEDPFQVASLNAKWKRIDSMIAAERGDFEASIALAREVVAELEGKSFQSHHPVYIEAISDLATVAGLSGDSELKTRSALDMNQSRLEFAQRVFRYATPGQRRAFLQSDNPFRLAGSFDMPDLLLTTVLQWKGAGLDSEIREAKQQQREQNASDEVRVLLAERVVLKKNAMGASLSGKREEFEASSRKLQEVESSLAAALGGWADDDSLFQATPAELFSRLEEGDILCEFIQYPRQVSITQRVDSYGMLLIRKDRECVWRPLGPAAAIDESIAALRTGILDGAPNEQVDGLLREIYTKIFGGLEQEIGEAKTMLIAPDGALNFLPFAMLRDAEGEFLFHRFDLVGISTARDLLVTEREEASPNSDVLVISNPAFRETATASADSLLELTALRGDLRYAVGERGSAYGGVTFTDLPGTEKEGALVSEILKEAGMAVRSFSGSEAREDVISLRIDGVSPRFIHIATHGFYLGELESLAPSAESLADIFEPASQDPASGASPGMIPGMGGGVAPSAGVAGLQRLNPLFLSGLALAGAQNTVEEWQAGNIPPLDRDGILTAAEVADLDLSGTELVALSACDTGLGSAVPGEGIFGLRRAFARAGARNLVLTLWPISDAETVAFMEGFYQRIVTGGAPVKAFQETQRSEFNRHLQSGKENALASAIYFAGPFFLTASGKVDSP